MLLVTALLCFSFEGVVVRTEVFWFNALSFSTCSCREGKIPTHSLEEDSMGKVTIATAMQGERDET